MRWLNKIETRHVGWFAIVFTVVFWVGVVYLIRGG